MPEYEYQCPAGHRTGCWTTVAKHRPFVDCMQCGVLAAQVITAPLLVKVAQDVCYDSPIDGRPITNWQARQEDLKRNGCQEYDPEMKTDHTRRLKESADALDATIDAHVEEAITKMPTAKRGRLYSELTEQGVDANVIRTTPQP